MPVPNAHPAPAAVDHLLQELPQLWRGREMARPATRSTGFPTLDERLPGGGWPEGALIEIAPACEGIGELSVALPLLRVLCQENRPVVLVCPPHIPYAPALARAGIPLASLLWIDTSAADDAQWSAEQVLREGIAGAVLLWSASTDHRGLRRLQVAAETGQCFAFLYRPISTLAHASPAAVRIALFPGEDGVRADLVKVRGGHGSSLTLPLQPPRPVSHRHAVAVFAVCGVADRVANEGGRAAGLARPGRLGAPIHE